MPAPLLELRGVWREYSSGETLFAALKDINLTVEAGEMIAIVGPSGSGKSTLMNILGCLDRPTSGVYCIAGANASDMDADALAALRRERLGFVFQRYNLLSGLSSVENVEIPAIYAGRSREDRRGRAKALLERLKLSQHLDHHPNQLSGGQQQRVSIARALMNGGEVIFADEPTGALDSQVGEEVMAILSELHGEGHTIVLVTHDPNVAQHADRIVELSDGVIVAERRRSAARPSRIYRVERAHPTSRSVREVMTLSLEAARMAVRSMMARRLRSLLTILGIVIGIASVASVVALGRGGQEHILDSINIIGTNTIDVYPGKDFGDESAVNIHTLVPADAQAIAQQGHIDSVTPAVLKSSSVRYGSVSAQANVQGVGEDYFRVHNIQFSSGGAFSSADTTHLMQVIVIDDNTRKALFANSENIIGQVIIAAGVPFRVVGVTRPKDNIEYLGLGLNVWAPYTAVMGRILGQQHLKEISVRVSDTAPMVLVEDVITRLLVTRHGRKDFYIYNTDTIRRTIEDTTATMRLVVGCIALVSLMVGGIGVMNIMLVSVTERTREIGVRAAVGARRADILTQFLIEAVTVCLIGGVLGVGVAFAASFLFSRAFPSFPMIFSVASVATSVAVSTVIGITFGFIPARNAARLDPVEALARD